MTPGKRTQQKPHTQSLSEMMQTLGLSAMRATMIQRSSEIKKIGCNLYNPL